MNKALKALAVLLFAGSVFTCCIADEDDCGCKTDEQQEEELVEVEKGIETIIEEETCERSE